MMRCEPRCGRVRTRPAEARTWLKCRAESVAIRTECLFYKEDDAQPLIVSHNLVGVPKLQRSYGDDSGAATPLGLELSPSVVIAAETP